MNGRSGATGSNSLNIRVASCLALILTAYLSNVPCRAAELVMFETPGCTWCAAWDAEIGRVYPLTDEGKAAPLRRVDLQESRPDDLAAVRGVVHTPTFVLMDEGREIGRIRGYPGEDFYWGLLGDLIGRIPGPKPTG
jgi:thioredoxin-related protein